MVTGHCPFVAENPLALVDKHIKEYPTPPSHVNPNVPTHIEDVIMRALEKDRNHRFSTAEEMARALGYTVPMHDGEPARGPSLAIARTGPPPRRKPRTVFPSGGLQLVRADGTMIALRGRTTPLNRRDVNPSDLEISRNHARLVERGGNYWIEDLGSSNGTFVNGLRIFRPQVVRAGDEIRLGKTVLRVEA
jgi:serine/threonine protein kinase